jgi:hypothetical protein
VLYVTLFYFKFYTDKQNNEREVMKKVLVLLSVLMLFSFAFANPWSHRYDTWQAEENPSINTGNTLTFAVEWGEGWWTSTSLGYGTSGDGSGWTWIDIPWVEDGEGTNKRCSTTVTFNSAGTYYYVFKMVKDGNDYHNDGNVIWDESSLDFASVIVSYVNVVDEEVPVTLASFTAEALKGKVELAWVTESEAENSHFLVYRDGEVIGRVDGNGTTTETHNYSFVDDKVVPGVHEYALADVTYGGVEEMHESVEVEVKDKAKAEVEAGFTLEKAYPNPFNPDTRIEYYLSRRVNLRLGVYNLQGEKVADLYNGIREAGTHTAVWDATGFPSGIYVVRMMSDGMLQTMKVVLMK